MHKYACSLCARRKVKCDKGNPCDNCFKAQAQCLYEPPIPHRPRKRPGDEEILTRLAQYEGLMRKHNIDFSSYANSWVPSELWPKMKDTNPHTTASIISAVGRPGSTIYAPENTTENLEQCLWSNLSSELKYPTFQSLRHKHDPLRYPTLPLQFSFPNNQPELHELHPEPKHVFRLWQIFVDKINPLTKVVHVPTLQQRIIDTVWDYSKASKPLTAIMFAIYNLAITPMSSDECITSFGESKDNLLTRYRNATVQALVFADFLTTRDIEVLQATVLFLFTDPESELTSTLISAAIRIGQKMGIHQESTGLKTSFFEKEMCTRLWWQLLCLDSRSRALSTPRMKPLLPSEFGDVRLPLNLNDVDLHPDMVDPPTEQKGPTEMMCVLIKFEFLDLIRSSSKAAELYVNNIQGPTRGNMSTELEDDAINELEAIYQEKYLCNWDKNIPLHSLAHAVAKFTLSRMRFKVHHPRGKATTSNSVVYIMREESDMLFELALTAIEMVDMSIRGKLSSHLFIHMTFIFQLDAYIYVLSDLRRRLLGKRVDLAWRLVEDLYSDHPELIYDTKNPLFDALGDLTLEAWEARRKELACSQNATASKVTPEFIKLLWDKRKNVEEKELVPMPTDPNGYNLDGLMPMDDSNFNWEYWNNWNDVLRI